MPCKSASELRNWHGRSVRVEVICRKQSRPRSSYCQGNDVWNSKQTIRGNHDVVYRASEEDDGCAPCSRTAQVCVGNNGACSLPATTKKHDLKMSPEPCYNIMNRLTWSPLRNFSSVAILKAKCGP